MDTDKLEQVLRNRWFWVVPPIVIFLATYVLAGFGKDLWGYGGTFEDVWIPMILFGWYLFPAGFLDSLGIMTVAEYNMENNIPLVVLAPLLIYAAYAYFIYRVKILTRSQLYTIAIVILLFALLTINGCGTMDYGF